MSRGVARLAAVLVVGACVGAGSAVSASADPPPLEVKALSFAQATVDATTGNATNKLTWTVTDTSAGASIVSGTLDIRRIGATPGSFVGPTYSVSFTSALGGGTQGGVTEEGNAQRSTYTYNFLVPRYAGSTTAKWGVSQITLKDDISHARTVGMWGLMRFHACFTATELVDSAPPGYDWAGLSPFAPDAVYVADGTATVDYGFDVTDDESGFSDGSIVVSGPGGASVTTAFQVGTESGMPTCGADENGDTHWMFCDILVTYPKGAAAGVWTVSAITLNDVAGNHITYGGLSLSPVNVTEDSVFYLDGFTLDPAQVSRSALPQTVQLTMSPHGGSGTVASVTTVTDCSGEHSGGSWTVNGDGTVSTSLVVFVQYIPCTVTGIEVTDTAGNAAVYGSFYGGPALNLAVTPTS